MNDTEIRCRLEELHRSSFGWALSCCSYDRDEAEDVLQTAYLKVLEGRARFGGRSSFRTWLFAVIRKTALDARRRHVLRGRRHAPYREGNRAVDPGPDPQAAAGRSEMRGVVRRALGTLPDRQREALQLVFYHGLSVGEAAGVMGVSVGSARTHYDRGKKRLRRRLEETGIGDELRRG